MADQTNTDIAVLQTEIKQLRADVAKIAETMRDIANNGVAGAGQRVQASTEKIWTEVKRKAGTAGREIEERPVASVLTAFGAGVLLGFFHNRRRGATRPGPHSETGNVEHSGANPPLPHVCGGVTRRTEELS